QQLLRAVLPHEFYAALRERRQLVGGHVLDGGEDLHVAGVAAACGDAFPHAFEVVPDPLGAEVCELASHVSQTSPAWRPVTPLSRLWEKKSSGRQLVQRGNESIFVTPRASSFCWATTLSESMRPLATPWRSLNSASTSSPTS